MDLFKTTLLGLERRLSEESTRCAGTEEPTTRVKPGVAACVCNSVFRRQTRVDPLGSLASHCSQSVSPRFSERPCSKT